MMGPEEAWQEQEAKREQPSTTAIDEADGVAGHEEETEEDVELVEAQR
jgi:hypothetical protein